MEEPTLPGTAVKASEDELGLQEMEEGQRGKGTWAEEGDAGGKTGVVSL